MSSSLSIFNHSFARSNSPNTNRSVTNHALIASSQKLQQNLLVDTPDLPKISPAAVIALSDAAYAYSRERSPVSNALNAPLNFEISDLPQFDQKLSVNIPQGSPQMGSRSVSISVNLTKGESYQIYTTGYGYVNGSSTASISAKNSAGVSTNLGLTGTNPIFIAPSSGSYTLTWTLSNSLSRFNSLNAMVYGKSNLPTTSGDPKVDALLMGGTRSWWHSIAPTKSSSSTDLIKPSFYSLASGSSATNLTYSFLSSPPTNAQGDANGFTPFTPAEKDAVSAALSYIASITKLTFTYTDSSDSANINFGNNLQEQSDGYAYLPNNSPSNQKTYVYINNKQPGDLGNFSIGTYGWQSIFHEIGHAVGLKHPGNYNATGGGASPPFLPANEDTWQYSIMSYYPASGTSAKTSSYMLYDVEALQYLYGVNNSGSTAVSGSFVFNSSGTPLQTLWSKNGTDVIDLSSVISSSVVNLNAGTFSSINGVNDVAIAYGSNINKVTLATNSSTQDKVYLNQAYKNSSWDVISNLTHSDVIDIAPSVISGLSATNLQIGGSNATGVNKKLIVDTANRVIYYDADGSGAGAKKKIASYTLADSFDIGVSNFSFTA